ncbi:MAG: alginate export family protein [bacterium]|nr:alginate export family protein [bacterium]
MKRISPFFALLCFVLVHAASGQDSSSGSLDFKASLRSRLEMWDWYSGDANNDYAFLGSQFRFAFGQKGQKVDWNIDLAAPILLGLPNDAAAPPPQGGLGLGANYFGLNHRNRNAAMVFPKQAFLRFHSPGASGGHSLRLGRFDFIEGMELAPKNATLAAVKRTRIQQRLIGSFGWTHVGRSYNGFHYSYSPGGANVTVAGAMPSRGVFQVDAWGIVKTAFSYGALTKSFTAAGNAGEVRVFGIYYRDWRPIGKTDNRPGAIRGSDRGNVEIGTFGGHYIQAVETGAGTIDLMLWGAAQTGAWGSLDHRGGAIAAEGGFQPQGLPALRPWIRGGYFYSTGDGNPNDDSHDTFFQVLPTARIYARFPFFNLMNLNDAFAELVLRPASKLTIRSDVRSLRLSNRADLWYAGGGVFNPWVFGYVGRPSLGGRGLATLYDVSVDVQASKKLKLSGYFAFADGKAVMAAIYPDGQNAKFGYLELSHSF